MNPTVARCTVCGADFEIRFRFQVREAEGGFAHVCSHGCLAQLVEGDADRECSICAKPFPLEFPFQVASSDAGSVYFCSTACRNLGLGSLRAPAPHVPRPRARRIAVFNHKGGTGKTTTAVNLAAGLAERGRRVLLVDADGQGNVGACLGISGDRSLYHVLVHGQPVEEVAIPVRRNLDVLCSNELLAAAELHLATLPNRHRVLRERLGESARGYDVVVLDCAPALSLMNQNALVYADGVIVPVSCDYLSLVGVKQVLRTVRQVRELLRHDVEILGVLPTFYDVRNRIGQEAVDALTAHFGDRCLPPIRINTRLREAPAAKQTIFEHAPDSNGAADYLRLVDVVDARWEGRRPSTVAPPVVARARVEAAVSAPAE